MAKKKEFNEINLILIVAAAALILSLFGKSEPSQEAAKIQKAVLMQISGNAVLDSEKIAKINSMDYQSLKKSFDVRNDFCIFIEDENGNVLLSKGAPSLNNGACV
jgi:tartrate dehydratase beta subunit/fumarate hydratase class I family protein